MPVFGLGLAVLLLDQLAKQSVRATLSVGESRPVLPGFFDLVYVRNDGAAWNLLGGHGVVLTGISVAALIALFLFRRAILDGSRAKVVFMGLLVGGIAGNLVDRIRFGWVTDFLDFRFGSYHYPAFNVADSAICLAVALYLVLDLPAVRRKRARRDDAAE